MRHCGKRVLLPDSESDMTERLTHTNSDILADGGLALNSNPLSFPAGSDRKEFACNAGDPGLIPG